MNTRYDTYTGGEHYYIIFRNGQHLVRRELPDDIYDDNETVFVGHYEDCVKFIDDLRISNYEYDLNL